MLRHEGHPLKRVVVCMPDDAYFGVTDLESHGMHEASDREQAVAQHGALVRVLEESGARVVEVSELAEHPNSTFTRDAALVTPEGNVQLRMGLPTRSGEPVWMAAHLAKLGEPTVGVIEPPGTVEGGDVTLAGAVAFVGRSLRTNDEGVRQLTALLTPMGYEVRVADMRGRYLHLGSALSVIASERVLFCTGAFSKGYFDGFDGIEVPSPPDGVGEANVVCVGENEVIARADDPSTLDALDAAGVRVHRLDLSEFHKGGGGPTCLILPVERG